MYGRFGSPHTMSCDHVSATHQFLLCRSFMPYACMIRVTSTMVLWLWFPYVEEFSILPCPTCLTCRTYISVGFVRDTFTDTVMCPVSKISVCIRYDGWCAKLGMWEMNIRNVRFVWDALSITMVRCMTYACGFVPHWSHLRSSWLRMRDICHLCVISTMIS